MHTEADVLKAVRAVLTMGHGEILLKIHRGTIESMATTFRTQTTNDLSRLSCRALCAEARGAVS